MISDGDDRYFERGDDYKLIEKYVMKILEKRDKSETIYDEVSSVINSAIGFIYEIDDDLNGLVKFKNNSISQEIRTNMLKEKTLLV